MSGDVLSRAEVEALLSGLAPRPQPAAADETRGDAAAPEAASVEVTPYDFQHPERLGKDEMEALQALHEGVAANLAAGISVMLRRKVNVKLARVEQLPFGEFVARLDPPTCLNVLEARPLQTNLLLELNPSILYPLIDRLLGGGHRDAHAARRPLTEIERRIAGRVTGLVLDALGRSWEGVLDLRPELVRVESTPQAAPIAPPGEVVVVIRFHLRLCEANGQFALCLAGDAVDRVRERLSAKRRLGPAPAPSPKQVEQIGQSLRGSELSLHVHLAGTRITTSELVGLRVGDIITTDKDIQSPLAVLVEGIPKFRAHPGAFKGRKAIRIDTAVSGPSEQAGEC